MITDAQLELLLLEGRPSVDEQVKMASELLQWRKLGREAISPGSNFQAVMWANDVRILLASIEGKE